MTSYKSGMYTDDGGDHWRAFVRHHPSGEVYIIEQDGTPDHECNYTALIGPIHHSEVTRQTLIDAVMSNADPDDTAWAADQIWAPVDLDDQP